MNQDLKIRLFEFAVAVVEFSKTIAPSIENNVIRYQTTKAGTSSGANYEEAQAGSSRADFNSKVDISLKEMRESNYWIRVIERLNLGDSIQRTALIIESEELKKILGSIAAKTRS